MKYFIPSLLLSFFMITHAHAGDRGTAEEAMNLVKKGAAYIKANGAEKAYAEISNPKGQFVYKDLYLFVTDMKGVNLAHGANQKLVGKNLAEIKDIDGKYFIKEQIEVAKTKGQGWVEYKWSDPIKQTIEQKSAYVEKLPDGTLIGCGIYK
jgi:cytochrome c